MHLKDVRKAGEGGALFTQSSFTLVQGAEWGWVSPQLIVPVAVTQSSLQGQHFGNFSFILQQIIVSASLAFWAKPLSNPQTQHFWLNHTSHPQNLLSAMRWFHVCELCISNTFCLFSGQRAGNFIEGKQEVLQGSAAQNLKLQKGFKSPRSFFQICLSSCRRGGTRICSWLAWGSTAEKHVCFC